MPQRICRQFSDSRADRWFQVFLGGVQDAGAGGAGGGDRGAAAGKLPPASDFPEEKAMRAAARRAVVDLVNEQQGTQFKTAAQVTCS